MPGWGAAPLAAGCAVAAWVVGDTVGVALGGMDVAVGVLAGIDVTGGREAAVGDGFGWGAGPQAAAVKQNTSKQIR